MQVYLSLFKCVDTTGANPGFLERGFICIMVGGGGGSLC